MTWGVSSPFYHGGPRDWTQVFRLGSKCINLLSHPTTSPQLNYIMKSYTENPTMSQFLCCTIISVLRNLGGQKAAFMLETVYNLFLPSFLEIPFFFLVMFSSSGLPKHSSQSKPAFYSHFLFLWVALFYLNLWKGVYWIETLHWHVFSFNMLKILSHWTFTSWFCD